MKREFFNEMKEISINKFLAAHFLPVKHIPSFATQDVQQALKSFSVQKSSQDLIERSE